MIDERDPNIFHDFQCYTHYYFFCQTLGICFATSISSHAKSPHIAVCSVCCLKMRKGFLLRRQPQTPPFSEIRRVKRSGMFLIETTKREAQCITHTHITSLSLKRTKFLLSFFPLCLLIKFFIFFVMLIFVLIIF